MQIHILQANRYSEIHFPQGHEIVAYLDHLYGQLAKPSSYQHPYTAERKVVPTLVD